MVPIYLTSYKCDAFSKVLYLTKFEKLFAISIFGNPVTEKDNFKVWMATHFPNLKFFDNKPLHEEKVSIYLLCVLTHLSNFTPFE